MDAITNLPGLLQSIVAGIATVPVVSWLLNNSPRQFNKGQKRFIAVGMSFALGIAATFLLLWLGQLSWPETSQGWLDVLWPACMGAFGASQMLLAALKSETAEKLKSFVRDEK